MSGTSRTPTDLTALFLGPKTVWDPLVGRPRGQVDFLAGFVDSLHRMLRDDPRLH